MSLRSSHPVTELATTAGAASDRRRHPLSLLAGAGVRSRLLALLGLAGAVCVLAEVAVGALGGPAALTALALAIAVPAATGLALAATPAGSAATRSDPFRRVKTVLVLSMAAGVIAYVGGGGTFASFTAETSNSGNSTSSGTLTMSNTVDSGTACLSSAATTQDNVNAACAAALTLSNLAPGVFGGTAQIAVENTGSIDGSKLWLWAPPTSTTLSSALTSGSSISSLPVTALTRAIVAGQSVVVESSPNSQVFTASSGAAVGDVSIPVTSQTVNAAYPSGSSVNAADCRDSKTTTGATAGATSGTDLNFNPTAGNPFCDAALLYVQEITGTVDGSPGSANYCWFGKDYADGSGMCVAPISVTLRSALSTGGAITSLPVVALNGNVRSGDTIVVTSGTHQQQFTASANAYVGAETISVGSATPTFAYPTSSTVVDTTAQGLLNGDSAHTIFDFDTLHNGTVGPVELKPVTGNGAVQSSGPTVELGAGGTRTFLVGVYLPSPATVNQNQLQGLASTFGLTWHVDQ